jgi:hypothetical protein
LGLGKAFTSSNLAGNFSDLMRSLFRNVLVFGLLGIGTGGLLGQQWAGPEAGAVVGIIGGLLGGAMLSETVEKQFGWAATLGVAGAGVSAFVVLQAGLEPMWWVTAGLVGGVAGFFAGVVGKGFFWTLLWAFVGAFAGNYFGNSMGGMYAEAWAGGAFSGGVSGMVMGVLYWAWRKFG